MVGGIEGKLVAIDGKTLRHSYDTKSGKRAIHIVTAFAVASRAVLGVIATREKSNEITAIPELLRLLDLKGAIVSIDAMGCQHKIIEEILKQGAEYLIGVKLNQPTLYSQIETAFATAEIADEPKEPERVIETDNTGHGREEWRKATVLDFDGWLDEDQKWESARSLVMVESERTTKGKTSSEIRYFISSCPPDAEKLGTCVREHWGIENKQHYILDTEFSEDGSRIRENHAPTNFATLRRVCLSLIQAIKPKHRSVRSCRFRAGTQPKMFGFLINMLLKPLSVRSG
jgi:predicted transposase YbfD/YdcC